MMDLMDFDDVKAVIAYDPDIGLFRGEFVGLNGGADFYAADIEGLRREGAISLRVFKEACVERGIPQFKSFSGKFNVRIPPKLHAAIAATAQAQGMSLNHWVETALETVSRS